MPRREGELIGHTECPWCNFPNAEVRRDRTGNPYFKCTGCDADRPTLFFTEGRRRKVDRLLARTRRVSVVPAP